MALETLTKVAPASQVLICKGVPFGNDYLGTILFDSYDAQKAYFTKHAKYNDTAMKPFTLGEPIRVPHPAEQMYECNYIYFTSQTSARHWCAFITNIERVNQNCADIYYELDVLQNWQLEWDIPPCYVLREHVNDDTPGLHVLPEPIDTGDYVYTNHTQSNFTSGMSVVVFALKEVTSDVGKLSGGIYNGVVRHVFDVEDDGSIGGLTDLLQQYQTEPDKVVAIFMYPKLLVSIATGTYNQQTLKTFSELHYTNIDGYKPHNYKLYAYPYNMIYATTNEGSSGVYRYEWFKLPEKPEFAFACAMVPNGQFAMCPTDYAGVTGSNWDEKVAMQPFPLCAWVNDTYKAYIAQNGVNIVGALAGSAISTVGGAVMASNPATAIGGIAGVVGGISSFSSTLQDIRNHDINSEQSRGNIANSTVYSLGYPHNDFHLYQKTITSEFARSADAFFDLFGYEVDTVKVPNLKGRPFWNYVKTGNIQIRGEIALDDISKLQNIFNRGVTFWHDEDYGNYGRLNK